MKGNNNWKAIEKCEDEKLITTLAMLCPFSDAEKQTLMEANSLNERAKLMKVILEMSILEWRSKCLKTLIKIKLILNYNRNFSMSSYKTRFTIR